MYFGMPFSTPVGNPEDVVIFTQPPRDLGGTGVRVRVKMASGYAQWGRLIVDGVPQGNPQYIYDVDSDEGATEFRGLYNTENTKHITQIMPMGDWSSPMIDCTPMPVFFQEDRSNTFNISWKPVPEIFSYGDTSQFSSWSFNDTAGNLTIQRFANCKPVKDRPSWGTLDIVMTTDGGVHTIELKKNDVVMATGSRTGNGSITFTAENDSELSGSVTLTYTADISADSAVAVRFPSSYKIHYKTTPFTAPDFPRTAEDTVLDNPLQEGNIFTYSSPVLTQPTYYVVVHQVDDCGNEGDGIQGGGAVVALVQPPEPPGTPIYVSGGYAATVISFTASSTVGATYNIYDSLDTGILDMTTVNHTHIAGTGTISDTLSAIAAGFTGNRFVIVRALNGGIEEGNNNILSIEYASGVVIKPRTPIPYASGSITVSGLTLTIPYAYDIADQLATATLINYQINTKSDFTGTDVTGSVGVGTQTGNSVIGTVAISAAVFQGPYFYRLWTSNATSQSNYSAVYGPVQLEITAPTDPASIVVQEGVNG